MRRPGWADGVEATVWAGLCLVFIAVMGAGDSNGFGVFHQPRNGIVVPLVVGGLINAATFWLHASVLIPRTLGEGRKGLWAAGLVGLYAGNVGLQIVTQLVIIVALEPSLKGVGVVDLARENSYAPVVVLLASALWRFARDWPRQRARARDLEAGLTALGKLSTVPPTVRLGVGRDQIRLPAADIRYLKAAGNYVEVHAAGRMRLVYGTLKAVLQDLPQEFARIHRSYAVNLAHVTAVRAGRVWLGDRVLPVGDRYRRALLDRWRRD